MNDIISYLWAELVIRVSLYVLLLSVVIKATVNEATANAECTLGALSTSVSSCIY